MLLCRYSVRGLKWREELFGALKPGSDSPGRGLTFAAFLSAIVLGLTGFGPYLFGSGLSGLVLLAHLSAAPFFLYAFTAMIMVRARGKRSNEGLFLFLAFTVLVSVVAVLSSFFSIFGQTTGEMAIRSHGIIAGVALALFFAYIGILISDDKGEED